MATSGKNNLEAYVKTTAVASESLTDVIEIPLEGARNRVVCTVENGGSVAIDQFVIYGKLDVNSNWISLRSASSEYTSPTGILRETGSTDGTGNLTAIDGGETGHFIIDEPFGWYSFKVAVARAAATSADVVVRATVV
jgi:hypothetical protein